MAILPTNTITPSEPGGALRLDARAAANIVSQPDGLRSVPQYGCEVKMTALNQPTGYVVAFAQTGQAPQVIPFTSIDLDVSEFNDDRPQADAQNGTITCWQDGLYEIGVQAAFALPNVKAHVELSIWTDFGAVGIPAGAQAALQEGQPYGTRWQRIGQRNMGFLNSLGAQMPSNPLLPYWAETVVTVVCVRTPATGAGGQPTWPHAIPPPCRFCFGIQSDATGVGTPPRVRGDVPGQTKCWMRWLGDPG